VNIQEYISSGIIESYVLGLASAEERIEFEQMCAQYPELVKARNDFELALEKQAMENATVPPAYARERILSALQQTPGSKTSKIIAMEPTNRRSSGLRWIAAASIILFLAAGYFAYNFYDQNKKLQDSNKELTAKIIQKDSLLKEQEIMNDPNVTVISMVGTKPGAPSANVYWDTTSANVFLVVKNMPKLASDKQYQLWALLDGKPIDLGLFDGGKEKMILKMNNTQKADAFAITIENKGNTGGPDLGQLQSTGKAKL